MCVCEIWLFYCVGQVLILYLPSVWFYPLLEAGVLKLLTIIVEMSVSHFNPAHFASAQNAPAYFAGLSLSV